MNTKEFSNLFEGGGALITPSPGERLADLDFHDIVSLFELKGALLFRGFDLEPNEISTFTDLYTENYAADALRRKQRFGQKVVHDVDYGTFAAPLHSEASFSPSWPEIVWFYCNVPPSEQGQTTLCDGIKLWQNLSPETRSLFLAEPLRYELEFPAGQQIPGKGTEPWISTAPGVVGHLDWDTGVLHLTMLRYAVCESRLARRLSLVCHLLGRDPQVKNITFASGTAIREEILDEIREKSDSLTQEIPWEKRDLAMIDNLRFMHGRRAYEEGVPRDIVNVQTSRASFGYGATTRQRIKRA